MPIHYHHHRQRYRFEHDDKTVALFEHMDFSPKLQKAHTIHNYPGLPATPGKDLMKQISDHAMAKGPTLIHPQDTLGDPPGQAVPALRSIVLALKFFAVVIAGNLVALLLLLVPGVNIAAFTKEFNERTKNDMGLVIPVVITVYADRSFSFITKTPPAAVLIKKECNIESGSGVPNKEKVATISKASIQKIAELKMRDLNAASLEAAMSMIAGTARSMGVVVGE